MKNNRTLTKYAEEIWNGKPKSSYIVKRLLYRNAISVSPNGFFRKEEHREREGLDETFLNPLREIFNCIN